MAENEEVQQQFGVQRIFVKDASFESPMGLAVFGRPWQPKVNVDMNTKSEKVSDDSFEVVLTVTVTANLEEEAALLIEVQQAGVFLIKGLEQENLRQALGIMAPSLLFPYLRETIDSLAVKGGFPPIILPPIIFAALYLQAAQQAAQQQIGRAHV